MGPATLPWYTTVIKRNDVVAGAPPGAELSSWKQVASYLGVSIRTAQTLEQERGLPVHRLAGPRGRVSASTAELDAWKRADEASSGQTQSLLAEGSPSSPERTSQRRVLSAWRRRLLLAGIAALVLALGLGARFVLRVAQPSSYRVERNALVVFDDAGRVLWRKVFPFPLHEASYEEDPGRSVWIGDLDRTGRKSVLFVLIPVGEPRQSSPLICFDDHGAEQWRYVPDRRVRTRLAEFVPTYGVSRFLVTALQAGGPNHILAASTHFPYYPSQVALLSTSGSLLREYWHSGHLNHLQAADLNGDGKTEFYAAGISNPRHAATLVALDPDHFGGASAEPETPDYQLLDMGRGIERARVLLPRSCLSAAFDPYNTIALLTILKNEVLVETKEHIVGGGGILHHFSPDLTLHRSVFADSYRIEYRAAKTAGKLPASCKADVIEDARIIALSK